MANTFEKIQAYTVATASESEVTFSSIPQTFDDLVIHASARTTNSGVTQILYMKFNSDSSLTTNKNTHILYGNGGGGSAQSSYLSGCFLGDANGGNSPTYNFNNCEAYLMNYRSAVSYKMMSSDSITMNGSGNSYLEQSSLRYESGGSAISSITIALASNYLAIGSSFALYGIKYT